MKYHIREKIRELEEQIFSGYCLKIFRGYVAVDKRGVDKIIDEIYSTLPQDVIEARTYLKKNNVTVEKSNQSDKNNIYDILRDLEIMLNKTCFIFPFTIVSKKEFKKINDELKNSIPEEINRAENLDK